MKFVTIFGAIGLLLVSLVGCGSDRMPVIVPHADEYVVSVMLLKLSDKSKEDFVFFDQAVLEKVVNRRNTDVTYFPVVSVKLGQTREIDNREKKTFLTHQGTSGKMTQYGHLTVGTLLRASLGRSPQGKVALHIVLDSVKITEWEETEGADKQTYQLPKHQRASLNTTLIPELSQWTIAVSNKDHHILVRIDPPMGNESTL